MQALDATVAPAEIPRNRERSTTPVELLWDLVASPLAAAERLALCGGVALYLSGHAAFRLRMTGQPGYAKLPAAAACLLLFAISGGLAPWALAGIVAGLLALVVVFERLAERAAEAPSAP